MSVVEDVRKGLQDFLTPELREIRAQLVAMEEISKIRHDFLVQRLDKPDQSFAFDKRLTDLESDRKRSA
jgi:hypothetical protein